MPQCWVIGRGRRGGCLLQRVVGGHFTFLRCPLWSRKRGVSFRRRFYYHMYVKYDMDSISSSMLFYYQLYLAVLCGVHFMQCLFILSLRGAFRFES